MARRVLFSSAMSLPASIPRALPQGASLVSVLVALREAADNLTHARGQLDAPALLAETRSLVEAAISTVQRVQQSATTPYPPTVAQAEAFALRELTAARRHQDLAGRSNETCRAACELALRCLTRAVDTLLAQLVPHTLNPLPR